ncbi:secreted protein/lipoprotein (plasmid) [Streptomyces sp. NBC_01255]|uniref:secreted protein/lipoprotein n=1 Tax=Streptomyces sp. NBC_01255 TaxID=2903798 RepID=UPI002E34EF83|nr:secreted protein/lipoprotein [Streptomyces sp. NBC_01255]
MAPSKTEIPVAPADPVETAKKEAIATYLSHWKEVEKRYADKAGKAGDLKKYAASAALSQVETGAADMRKKNAIVLGTVAVGNPTATSADINRKIPHVILSSCLDISRWTVTDLDTQKPAALPKNRLLRYVIKATIEKWPEGWRVIRDEPQGKKC